ncbi:hypothetical protein [Pedobacter antarcticus]|uniref:hypothetical protein n=1 Tax=Pedobacter antarcticus TaxID=34086 RepID=UPI00088E61B4|nr:hypothetical protein [Pedobacter antarcticus]SDM83925.1 hypothetical protein SAMN04488084_11552 [Pedobacter antarcticus]
MKELDDIIVKIKQVLDAKEQEIETATSASTYAHSALENRKLEVALFENSARHVTTDPTQKINIIANFEKDAKRLIDDINKIEV